MKTIYAVTAGEYSDYGIVGLFSTREKAEQYMAAFPKDGYSGYNDIEEYSLDTGLSEIARGLLAYCVRMYKDGEVHDVLRESVPPPADLSAHWYDSAYWKPSKLWTNFYVWAKSDVAAIKIANERRIQALAGQP